MTTIGYLQTISRARSLGFRVTLLFVWLDSPSTAIARVQKRVAKGGHNIPAEIINRRYIKGIKNLPKFMKIVADWYLFDNSESSYELVAKCVDNKQIVLNFDTYMKICPYGS